jgi:hypothetical protein
VRKIEDGTNLGCTACREVRRRRGSRVSSTLAVKKVQVTATRKEEVNVKIEEFVQTSDLMIHQQQAKGRESEGTNRSSREGIPNLYHKGITREGGRHTILREQVPHSSGVSARIAPGPGSCSGSLEWGPLPMRSPQAQVPRHAAEGARILGSWVAWHLDDGTAVSHGRWDRQVPDPFDEQMPVGASIIWGQGVEIQNWQRDGMLHVKFSTAGGGDVSAFLACTPRGRSSFSCCSWISRPDGPKFMA